MTTPPANPAVKPDVWYTLDAEGKPVEVAK